MYMSHVHAHDMYMHIYMYLLIRKRRWWWSTRRRKTQPASARLGWCGHVSPSRDAAPVSAIGWHADDAHVAETLPFASFRARFWLPSACHHEDDGHHWWPRE